MRVLTRPEHKRRSSAEEEDRAGKFRAAPVSLNYSAHVGTVSFRVATTGSSCGILVARWPYEQLPIVSTGRAQASQTCDPE